ncbi:MAG TPA: ATP-binding cassette domain-containing protein [Longimicrobiales bacterium]|nr:ATP-binding cassette domain-containing protein [Longimicrobiales bacterium]
MPTVTLTEVRAGYRRRDGDVLRALTLTLSPGVIGIGGPNGAGKSTLLRVLLGCLVPTAGECRIDGEPPGDYLRRAGIGFVPESPAFDDYLTVDEFLTGIRRLARGTELHTGASAVAVDRGGRSESEFALDAIRHQRLGRLSLGQRRRVALAAAAAGSPDLMLLDEPTNGLDPVAVAWLREEIQACRRAGRSILIASHHLDELERLVDRIVILRAGRAGAVWDRAAALDRFGSFDALFHATIAAGADSTMSDAGGGAP